MWIKRVRIDHYGPLSGVQERHFSGFTLVYGSNEQGKTLFIDAILRLLFKKELNRVSKHLGNIGRVTDPPEGSIVLQAGGKDIELRRNETLSKYLPISAADFRNIFVVRDSDVAIVDEGDYYARVTEKIAGLRTTEIEAIKRVLQKRGRLTNPSSKGSLSDSSAADHMAGRVKDAEQFVTEIDERLERYRGNSFDDMERRIVETRERIATAERDLHLLRQAEKRTRLEKAKQSYDELDGILKSLSQLDHISEKDAERWQECELEKKRIHLALDATMQRRLDKEKQLDGIDHEYARVHSRLEELDVPRKDFEERLRPAM